MLRAMRLSAAAVKMLLAVTASLSSQLVARNHSGHDAIYFGRRGGNAEVLDRSGLPAPFTAHQRRC